MKWKLVTELVWTPRGMGLMLYISTSPILHDIRWKITWYLQGREHVNFYPWKASPDLLTMVCLPSGLYRFYQNYIILYKHNLLVLKERLSVKIKKTSNSLSRNFTTETVAVSEGCRNVQCEMMFYQFYRSYFLQKRMLTICKIKLLSLLVQKLQYSHQLTSGLLQSYLFSFEVI